MDLPEVKHFVSLNPGFEKGDELSCVANLSFLNIFLTMFRTAKKMLSRRPKTVFIENLEQKTIQDTTMNINQNSFVYLNKPFEDIRKVELNTKTLKDIRILYVTPGPGAVNYFGNFCFSQLVQPIVFIKLKDGNIMHLSIFMNTGDMNNLVVAFSP